MKKLLGTIFALCIATTAFAQASAGSLTIRPEVGGSMSNVLMSSSFTSNYENNYSFGFLAGAEAIYQVNDKFAISGGLLYTQEGCELKSSSVKDFVDIDYINVPLLAQYYIAPGLAVKGGVMPGYAVNAKWFNRTDYADNYMKKFDLAIPVGVSYEISNVVLDARFNIGALDFCKESFLDTTFNNMFFTLTIGYNIVL